MSSSASTPSFTDRAGLDAWAVDDARRITFEMCVGAETGHPGSAIGMAPMMQCLFHRHLNVNPAVPDWMNRDKFVMSVGHAVNIQYVLMQLLGFPLTETDLKGWRVLGSLCPGHPENYITPGIECCTGPLGQGIGQAVGMAIAERHLAQSFNKPGLTVFDNFTYCVVGEGCIMEGVGAEVSSLAGSLGLARLIVLFDNNDVQLSGDTQENNFTEDVAMRYRSYNWQVIEVEGSCSQVSAIPHIEAAILEAKADTERPSIIIMKTVIGEGLGNGIAGTIDAHVYGKKYTPETCDEYRRTFKTYKESADYKPSGTSVAHYAAARKRVQEHYAAWEATMASYAQAYPAEHAEIVRRFDPAGPVSGARVEEVFADLKEFTKGVTKPETPRASFSRCFTWAKEHMPELVGGSADVSISCKTHVKGEGAMSKGNYLPRNVEFGVREMAMVTAVNGMAAHGGFVPYCAAMMNFFTGYAMNGIRIAGMSEFNTMMIMTHDSISVGADGASHQPVECLPSLRATPNMRVWRPADSAESVAAFVDGVDQKYKGPSTVSLARDNTPQLLGLTSADLARMGGYVLRGVVNPKLVVVATGEQLSMALNAVDALPQDLVSAIQVVSLPCVEVFRMQTVQYRKEVFPEGVPVFSCEASSTCGWVAPWGDYESHHGVDAYGGSGTPEALLQKFGFTVPNIAAKIKATMERNHSDLPLQKKRRKVVGQTATGSVNAASINV